MGLFRRIFKKAPPLLEPADLSILRVDVHSHLIPGIDDGAETMEESLQMLQRFEELGFKKVITTPHVMSDHYRNTPEIILGGLEKVRSAAKGAGLKIEIEAAAEYYLDDAFEGLLERAGFLTFGNRMVLFELPFIGEPANLNRAIFDMQLAGYKPVLAHPERYTYWHQDFEKYQELHDKGVILQVNMNSFSGAYSPEVQKVAFKMAERGLIGLLGSDCHRMDHLDLLKDISSRVPAFHDVLRSGHLGNQKL